MAKRKVYPPSVWKHLLLHLFLVLNFCSNGEKEQGLAANDEGDEENWEVDLEDDADDIEGQMGDSGI